MRLRLPHSRALPKGESEDALRQDRVSVPRVRGAQSIIDSTAEDLREWREEREASEVFNVSRLLSVSCDLVLEVAMDGVMSHIDGDWHEAKAGTILARRREDKTDEGEPRLDRSWPSYACVYESPDDLAFEIKRGLLGRVAA